MTDERKRRASIYLTAMSIVLVLLGAYVGGYFVLGEYHQATVYDSSFLPSSPHVFHVREFSYPAMLTTYLPMGWLECQLRGESVHIECLGNTYHLVVFDPP